MDKEYILADQLSYSVAHNSIIAALSFSIGRGDCVAIVGANGCGKTTLLKLMCGLLKPSSGQLILANLTHANAAQSLLLKNIVGYAPDTLALYPHDSVYTYLRFIAELHQLPHSLLQQRIEQVLLQFDLNDYAHQRLASLSRGTQQRVNLAQALLHAPKILLLDEPSNALDQEHTATLCNYIQLLRKEQITIIIASHDYNEMIPLCDYMLRISAGKIRKTITPLATKEIKEHHDQFDYTS